MKGFARSSKLFLSCLGRLMTFLWTLEAAGSREKTDVVVRCTNGAQGRYGHLPRQTGCNLGDSSHCARYGCISLYLRFEGSRRHLSCGFLEIHERKGARFWDDFIASASFRCATGLYLVGDIVILFPKTCSPLLSSV
ncbi:hypothetical protein C8Q78DRAFT_279779 [Trametes maxima]|nr:hypothetical protein C8Q78DRAFT_279779 [Trametes maxima]